MKKRLSVHRGHAGLVRSLFSRIVQKKKIKDHLRFCGRRLYLRNFRAIRDSILTVKKLGLRKRKILYYKRKEISFPKTFKKYKNKIWDKSKFKFYKKVTWLSRYIEGYRKKAKFLYFDSKKFKRKFKERNRLLKLIRTKWIKKRKAYFRRVKLKLLRRKRLRYLRNILISLSSLYQYNKMYFNKYKKFVVNFKVKERHVKVARLKLLKGIQRIRYIVLNRQARRSFGVTPTDHSWLRNPIFKVKKKNFKIWRRNRKYRFEYRFKKLFNFRFRVVKLSYRKKKRPFFFRKRRHLITPFYFQKNYYFMYINSFIKRKIFFLNLPKNIICFDNKVVPVFFRPYLTLVGSMRRGYFNIFFFHILLQNASRFKPFSFPSSVFKEYIRKFNFFPNVEDQSIIIPLKNKGLEESPFLNKFKRLRALEYFGSNSLLYGYKFHFVGRFTRKQKAASLWFSKGANSVSSMKVDVDYGFHTVTLRYSACTLKVWLYKNKGYSFKYGYRMV